MAASNEQSIILVKLRDLILIQVVNIMYFIVYELKDIVPPQYIYDRAARTTELYANMTSDESHCDVNSSDIIYMAKQEAQKTAALWNIYNAVPEKLICVVTCLIFGTFSDRFGRRLLFLVPNIGVALNLTVYAVNSFFTLPLWMSPIGHFFNGLGGSYIVMVLATTLTATDVTESDQKRTTLMTVGYIIIPIGFSVGDFISGYAIDYLGFSWTFVLAIGISVLNIVLIYFIPETLHKKQGGGINQSNVAVEKKKDVIASYLRNFVAFYIQKSQHRKFYWILCAIYIFGVPITMVHSVIAILYRINSPFCWSSVEIGLVNGVSNLVVPPLVLIMMIKLPQYISDSTLGACSTVVTACGLLVTGLATNDIYIYVGWVACYGSYLLYGASKAILSKITPQDQQGMAQSSIGAIEMISVMLAGVAYNAIYKATVDLYGGTVYLVMASVLMLTTAGFIAIHILLQKETNQKEIYQKETYQKEINQSQQLTGASKNVDLSDDTMCNTKF